MRIGTSGAARITPSALIKPARSVDGVEVAAVAALDRSRAEKVEVAAVAARDRSRAEKFATDHGIPVVHGGEATYTYQLRAFAAAARGGPASLTPPEDSIANMTVIDDIYRKAGLPLRGTPSQPPE
jgi:predicted dehydrogenase